MAISEQLCFVLLVLSVALGMKEATLIKVNTGLERTITIPDLKSSELLEVYDKDWKLILYSDSGRPSADTPEFESYWQTQTVFAIRIRHIQLNMAGVYHIIQDNIMINVTLVVLDTPLMEDIEFNHTHVTCSVRPQSIPTIYSNLKYNWSIRNETSSGQFWTKTNVLNRVEILDDRVNEIACAASEMGGVNQSKSSKWIRVGITDRVDERLSQTTMPIILTQAYQHADNRRTYENLIMVIVPTGAGIVIWVTILICVIRILHTYKIHKHKLGSIPVAEPDHELVDFREHNISTEPSPQNSFLEDTNSYEHVYHTIDEEPRMPIYENNYNILSNVTPLVTSTSSETISNSINGESVHAEVTLHAEVHAPEQ